MSWACRDRIKGAAHPGGYAVHQPTTGLDHQPLQLPPRKMHQHFTGVLDVRLSAPPLTGTAEPANASPTSRVRVAEALAAGPKRNRLGLSNCARRAPIVNNAQRWPHQPNLQQWNFFLGLIATSTSRQSLPASATAAVGTNGRGESLRNSSDYLIGESCIT